MIELKVNSEIEKLEAVLIHQPGPEVENMTPATAERALYSDILNLSVASTEYAQFKSILQKVTKTYELQSLLEEVLINVSARNELVERLARYVGSGVLIEQMKDLSEPELAKQIIEGIPLGQMSLSNFLNQEKYLVSPLHNAFFTRDSSFIYGNTAHISSMARKVRQPEAFVMNTIFQYHDAFKCSVSNFSGIHPESNNRPTMEGGDVLILSDSALIIGIGSRTNPKAVDALVNQLALSDKLKYVLVQELPEKPESFIHLDMVFTLLNEDECLIYEPLIMGEAKYHTVLMEIDNRRISKISQVDNLLSGLKKIGRDFSPITCGGKEQRAQEREQWHSGANMFAFAPGKVIGYGRNVHTMEALNNNGYRIVSAEDFVKEEFDGSGPEKIAITIEGAELARGGGGGRCMTMPLARM